MRVVDKVFPLGQIPRRLANQWMRNRWGQRLMVPFGRELAPQRWVFIISCYDSGTTLLKEILARHPEIGALPGEGVRFTDSLPRPEQFGWNRMWCRCVEAMRLGAGCQEAERARRIKRQWSIVYPKGRPNLLEKSIANAARLPFLDAHFQPAYFVYLVRNGYAAAEGIRRKARPWLYDNPQYRQSYPIELCAEQWRETDRLVMADHQVVDRFLQLYYEELTGDPAGALRQITDFLGVAPLPEQVVRQRWKIHGVEAPIANMNDRSFARLSAADLDAIERVAGAALARHGYGRPKSVSGAT